MRMEAHNLVLSTLIWMAQVGFYYISQEPFKGTELKLDCVKD